MRKTVLILAILLTLNASAATAERPLFVVQSEYLERPRQHVMLPPPAVARPVLATFDSYDRENLNECVAQQNLAHGDYRSLLRAVRIRSGPSRVLWFIRPAFAPYSCLGLHGAHSSRFYVVEERATGARSRYRLLYDGGGDAFEIYARLHHGLNDIAPSGCDAHQCWTTRMAYDGIRYRPYRCTHTTPGSTEIPEITRPVPCVGAE